MTSAKDWFGQDTRSLGTWNPGDVPKPVSGNTVRAFISPVDYYVDLGATIRATGKSASDLIYITGWELDLATYVDSPGTSPRATLGELLKAACQNKTQVRVLLDSTINKPANTQVAEQIRDMGGGAIIDPFHQPAGSQHQKAVICRAGDRVTAYCGGMDIANHRLGRDGLLGAPGPNTSNEMRHAPWHDVQVSVDGPAAVDVWNAFVQRWETTTSALKDFPIPVRLYPISVYGDGSIITAGGPSVTTAASGGGLDCRVVRTYPNPETRVLGIPEMARAALTPFAFGYQFAPKGERGNYDLLVNAINRAETSIYLEDQYLVDTRFAGTEPPVTDALSRTIAKSTFKKMVIAIAGTGTVQGELYQAASRRKEFYQQLGSGASSKVSVYCYRDDLNSPFWFHSKTWIFDDRFAVVTSANCNRRSYSCDSEIGLGIFDASSPGFAKDLRQKLWLKHLNARPAASPPGTVPAVTAADIDDFAGSADLWKKAQLLIDANLDKDMTPDIVISQAQMIAYLDKYGLGWLVQRVPYLRNLAAQAATREPQWELIDPDGA